MWTCLCVGEDVIVDSGGAKTAYVEPGSPRENGYCESSNGRMRGELLNGEIFYSLPRAQIIIERWRNHYNTKRPYSALRFRSPAPEAIIPKANHALAFNLDHLSGVAHECAVFTKR